jgi:hypothetical protein
LYWGDVLKSDSRGQYFVVSAANVNRDARGYVDFQEVAGLKNTKLINVVSNTYEAALTGTKALQTKISFDDGKPELII